MKITILKIEVTQLIIMEYSARIKTKQRLNSARAMGNSKFEDVTFIVGRDQMEFKANRMVLALISSVFEAMLFGPMQEGKTDSVITIEDIDANGFQSVLNFAYSKDPVITIQNVVSVKNVCRKYDVFGLSSECDEYFERCIDSRNFCILLDQSIKYKLDEYATKCMDKKEWIRRNAQDIVNSNGFMEMGMESMRLLLQCDDLKIGEEDLWDAVMKWAERKSMGLNPRDSVRTDAVDQEPPSKRRRLNDSKYSKNCNVNQSDLLRSVCPYIRFGLMNSKYFSERVKPTGCLSKDQMLSVFEYMTMKKENPQYECGIFSTKPRKRTFDLRLMKFEVSSPSHHRVSNDGLDIHGATPGDCQGYFVYPKALEPNGCTNGTHFWSLELMEVDGYYTERVAVVTSKRSAESIRSTIEISTNR